MNYSDSGRSESRIKVNGLDNDLSNGRLKVNGLDKGRSDDGLKMDGQCNSKLQVVPSVYVDRPY